MKTFGRVVAAATLATACALASAQSQATPQIEISNGVNSVVITDQGLNDLDGLQGSIVFAGALGNYFINVTTGVTKPILGSAEVPRLDLNSINVSGPAGSVLTIRFTETDFLTPSGSADIFSAIGGTTAGTLRYQTYASLTNDPFAQDILISDSGILDGPFVFSDLTTLAISGAYSITTVATITHSGGSNQNSSFNAVVDIPEPFLAPPVAIGALLVAGSIASRRRRG